MTDNRQQKMDSSQTTILQLKTRLQKEQREYDNMVEENKDRLENLYDFIGLDIKADGSGPAKLDATMLRTFKLAVQRVKYLTAQRVQNDRCLQQLEAEFAKQVRSEHEEQRKFTHKKLELQAKIVELEAKVKQGQQQQQLLYRQHSENYQRNVAELNNKVEPQFESLTKTMEITSNMAQLLNTLSENKTLYEQAYIEVDKEQKQAFRRRIAQMSEQRDHAIRNLKEDYQNKKQLLEQQRKAQDKANNVQQRNRQELRRTVLALLSAIEKQEKCIKQLRNLRLLPVGSTLHNSNASFLKKIDAGVLSRILNPSASKPEGHQPAKHRVRNLRI